MLEVISTLKLIPTVEWDCPEGLQFKQHLIFMDLLLFSQYN